MKIPRTRNYIRRKNTIQLLSKREIMAENWMRVEQTEGGVTNIFGHIFGLMSFWVNMFGEIWLRISEICLWGLPYIQGSWLALNKVSRFNIYLVPIGPETTSKGPLMAEYEYSINCVTKTKFRMKIMKFFANFKKMVLGS